VEVLVRFELARLGIRGNCCVFGIGKCELVVEERLGRQMDGNILHQEGGRGRSCCLVDILRSRRKDLGKEYEEDVQML
jgi:hypothetical protein